MRGKWILIVALITALVPAVAQARPAAIRFGEKSCSPYSTDKDSEAGLHVCDQIAQSYGWMTIIATSAPGMYCLARVLYQQPGKTAATRIALHPSGESLRVVPPSGSLQWQWNAQDHLALGNVAIGLVDCSQLSDTKGGDARVVTFTIHPFVYHPRPDRYTIGEAPAGAVNPTPAPATTSISATTTVSATTPVITPTPTSVVTTTTAARVLLSVSPNPIPVKSYPTVSIHTAPGAICDIKVVYSSGKPPVSYPEHSSRADASGTITEQGVWHLATGGYAGTIHATCTSNGASSGGQAAFTTA